MKHHVLLPLLLALLSLGCEPRKGRPSEAEMLAGQHLMALVKDSISGDLSSIWSVRRVSDCHGLASVELLSPLAEGGFLRGASYNDPPDDFKGPLVMRITLYERDKRVSDIPNYLRVMTMRDDTFTYAVERDNAEPYDITLKEDFRYIVSCVANKMHTVLIHEGTERALLGTVTNAEILRYYAWIGDTDPDDRNVLLLRCLARIGSRNFRTRARALAALGALEVTDPSIVDAIRGNLAHSSQAVRSNAAWALGKLGRHGAVALEDLRRMRDADRCLAVRHAANRAILRITGQWQEPKIYSVIDDRTLPALQ